MNLLEHIKIFLLTFPLFLAIDFTWLGLIAKKFYDTSLSELDRTLRWKAAALAYILLVSFIIVIAVPKYLATGNLLDGFLWGSLVGMVVYGAYDLTNMATLSGWSWKMVIVDMMWGTFLCGTTGLISSMFSNIVI